jgi:hypothetical protein
MEGFFMNQHTYIIPIKQMQHSDKYGQTISAENETAVQIYLKAVDSAIAGNAHSEKWFEQAHLLDPQFPLASAAYALVLSQQGKTKQALQLMSEIKNQKLQVSKREITHIGILQLLIEGQNNKALDAIIDHSKHYPHDVFLLSKAVDGFGLFSFNGNSNNPKERLQFMNSLEKNFHNDWWFEAMHAFALVEDFQLEPAKNKAEKALLLNNANGHAAHSFAHVCYETNQTSECIDFLSNWLPGYDRASHLYGHNYWHWALSELAMHNFDKVKQIYFEHLSPQVALGGAVGLVADAAALDWRSQLEGLTLLSSLQKDQLCAYASAITNIEDILFGEIHLALVYAKYELHDLLNQLLQNIRIRNQKNPHQKYFMMEQLIAGVQSYAEKDYLKAIQHLEAASPEINRLGGSNAQRELFEDTLIKAYFEAGSMPKANQIIELRMKRRTIKA